MHAEKVIYEWTCDGCGEVEGDEIDQIPDGWETLDEGDFCPACMETGSHDGFKCPVNCGGDPDSCPHWLD